MNLSNPIDEGVHQPAYQKIANGLRHDILSGKYVPGSLLPSTDEFAVIFKSSYFTVHTALKSLVKEGWVDRIHGQGTYVAQPDKRFLHAGIYHSLNIWSNEEASFHRRLNDCLVEKLQALNKTAHIIVDTRAEADQDEMFPALANAIFNRQIQCVISPDVNSKSLPLLSRLSMPTAFMTPFPKIPGVTFDEEEFMQGSVRSLVEQGCRTVGLISNVPPLEGNIAPTFLRVLRGAGLATHDQWVIQPSEYQHHLIEYGYNAFRMIHQLPELPDGMIIYTDTVARGVLLAILQCGVRVPEQMKFVFHRNAQAQFLCPIPVTWAICEESDAADGMIQSIQKQFEGLMPEPFVVPYRFERDDALIWRA